MSENPAVTRPGRMVALFVLVIVGLLIIVFGWLWSNNKNEQGGSGSSKLKTYHKNTTSRPGANNVGGSGSDTKPSPNGTGPGSDNSLLSQ